MKYYLSSDSFAVACGGENVKHQLKQNQIDVQSTGSYGLAWLEPLLEVRSEEPTRYFPNLTPNKVESVITEVERHSSDGTPSLQCNSVLTQSYYTSQTRLVFENVGHVPPLHLPETSLLQSLLSRDKQSIIDDVQLSGLRGRGGAGFPAHIKWRTVAETEADQRYIVCNADEGDSGTFSDRMLMEGDPFKLIIGMIIAGYATGSTKGYIYLRSEYPVALMLLEKAIEIAYSNNLLGADILDSKFSFNLEVFVGAGAYICGEETSLLESLEGKRGQIRIKPPVPAIAGLFGKPTLVHNVISLAAVLGIFQIGAAEYRALGVGLSSGTMPFQISGNIRFGGLIEIPFGASVRELVEDYGGGTLSGRPVKTVQIGGPLGAYLSVDEFDTPLTYEDMAEIGAGIGHGGLVVFDDTVDMREQAEYAFEFCEIESCGKCTPCRIGSVRGKEAVQGFKQQADVRTVKLIEDLCDVMESASLCQMGGMTPIPVRSALNKFPTDFLQ